jgi:hypothetical protein
MRNFSDESFRENKKKHFMFNNSFPKKTLPFMRLCGKIWLGLGGH